MARQGGSTALVCWSSLRLLWLLLSLCLLIPARVSGEVRWTTRQSDAKKDDILMFQDMASKGDFLTSSVWPFRFLTDKRPFETWSEQPQTSSLRVQRRLSERKKMKKLMKLRYSHSVRHLKGPSRKAGNFSKESYKFSIFPKRRKKVTRLTSEKKTDDPICDNEGHDGKRVRRSSDTGSDSDIDRNSDLAHLDDEDIGRQTNEQETPGLLLRRRTERQTTWTGHERYRNPSTVAEEAVAAPKDPKGDLVAEESVSAPIYVTIVQRNEENDYYSDKYPHYPPLPPPPPKYHHEPEYYPPPPPKYHPKPDYHPHPIPTYAPPPPIYHPVPDYPPPPPPPKYPQDSHYHHFEVQAQYYHGSDYNEPTYHKPKFLDESLYHHDIEYHPPPPPPLPLPKHKLNHPSHPPVYHPKIHHQPKHEHSYLPPTPAPPLDYYKEPVYPSPTNYEYHLDIYDRQDIYEPHYYDRPKVSTKREVLQPKPHENLNGPIEEIKQEYRKGSRAFDQSISHLPAVHLDGDTLYRDAPPHGFIKAKHEPSAIYHPESHHPSLRPSTPSYQRYNEAPLSLPIQPPAFHHDIRSDYPPKAKHLLSVHPNPLSSREPFRDVQLPAPLPSLEDVDPLIFEPIFSYDDYFDENAKLPVGDLSIGVSSLLMPRDSPFDFYLNEETIYSSQLPKTIKAFTNPPPSSILRTYKSPTFTAEEEEEEYYQNGLTYTLLTSAKPPLLPTTYSALPVTYNTSEVLMTPSGAPEGPIASLLSTPVASESPEVSKEIATTVTPVVHVSQEMSMQEPTNDSMIRLTISEISDSPTVITPSTLTNPRLKLIPKPTDLSVTLTTMTALSQTDNSIVSESFKVDDSSKMTQDEILFTVLTDTSDELADISEGSQTTQVSIADTIRGLQSTEPTVTPLPMMALPLTDNSVLTESLTTNDSFEMTDDNVSLETGPGTTREPLTMQGFITEPTSTRPILKLQRNKVKNKVNQTSTLTADQLAAKQNDQNRRDFLELFYPNRNPTLAISLLSPNTISPNDRSILAQFFLSNKMVSDSNASTASITEKEENLKSLTNNSSPEKQQKSPDQSKKRLRVKQSSKQEKNLPILQYHTELHSLPIAEDGFKPVFIPSELIATNKTSHTSNPYTSKFQSQTSPINTYSTKQSSHNISSGSYGSKSSSSSSTSSMYESKPIGNGSPVRIYGPNKSSKWLVTTQQEKILSLQRNSKTRLSSQVTDKNKWHLPVHFQL